MRWLLAAGAAGLLFIVAPLSMHGCSDNSPGGGQVRAGHGPTNVTGGVPTGYTRDRAGAATAAVNIVQALTQAGQGRVTASAVRSALAASNPGPGLTKSLDIASGGEHDSNVLNVLPAAVTVKSVNADTAQVAVWTVAVSRDSIAPGDPVSVMTLWSSTTVSLVWEHGDWKAKDLVTHNGPTPDQVVAPGSGSPLTRPLQGGYYTFYVD
ncbi:hypothetical protein [Nocardia arthritidis]|uniref:DUF8175 domain-containing protein n=1 Tax=Nocardia arthritidis TaxID=228602 RepID=A0A6G9Y9E9_9NOCA|nr:hypothetical protein [Nocardia arthritidis]QIS09841.1 hypothetical protein F5544_09705 [Nocardia arthritidis]